MDRFKNTGMSGRFSALSVALVCLVAGFFFYTNYRPGIVATYPDFLTDLFTLSSRAELSNFMFSSLPSVLFVIYMSAFSFALRIKSYRVKHIVGLWFIAGVIAEGAQGLSLIPGTFDVMDLFALGLGATLSSILLTLFNTSLVKHTQGDDYKPYAQVFRVLAGSLSIGLFYVSIAGSYCSHGTDSNGNCVGEEPIEYVDPVFLSVDTIRQDIEVVYGSTETLKRTGKIYLYDKYLLIVDEFKGIHVLDNTDASVPLRIAYIPILGVTDLSIKGGYLYSNSYVDLLAIDLNAVLKNTMTNESIVRHHNYFEHINYTDIINGRDRVIDSSDSRLYSEDYVVIGYIRDNGERVIHGELDGIEPRTDGILEE